MKYVMNPLYFLLTIFVWVGGMIGLLLGAVLGFITMPFLSQHRRHLLFFGPLMGLNVRLTFSRITVVFDPEFDPERRSVFCQNHVNMLDGQLACAVWPHEFCGLFSHWQVWFPGYGWILWMTGGIRVFPNAKNRTALITEQAKDRFRRGISILAYPEGHRTRTGEVGPFKRGSFFMARDAGYPVVPMCTRGMLQVNKPKHFLLHPGKVEVYIGKQMETQGLNDEQIAELADRMREIHVAWVERRLVVGQKEVKAA